MEYADSIADVNNYLPFSQLSEISQNNDELITLSQLSTNSHNTNKRIKLHCNEVSNLYSQDKNITVENFFRVNVKSNNNDNNNNNNINN